MMRYLGLMLLLFPVLAEAAALPASTAEMYAQLKLEVAQQRPVIVDGNVRERVVKNFIKVLSKFDDQGLGDVGLKQAEAKQPSAMTRKRLQQLQQNVTNLVARYQSKVKPILLNNIKLKRHDYAARYNKTSLSLLFFSTKYNHHTNQPIAGIFHYKEDVSDSFFTSKMVDAGLLYNFPDLSESTWVQDALRMDTELSALMRLHRAYQDGVVVVLKEKEKAPDISVVVPQLKTMPALSPDKRARLMQKFMWSVKKLDVKQPWTSFRQDLQAITKVYQQQIQRILVNNINLKRQDLGSAANRGALIALFYADKSNHKTGLPITGKLRYKKDVSGSFFTTDIQEVGFLVDNPVLTQDKVVQEALSMETELAALLKEHRKVIKKAGVTFLDE